MIIIVGSGVVGAATGKGLLQLGHDVTFVDVNDETLAKLRAQGYMAIPPEQMNLHDVTAVFVSVPTPSRQHGIELGHLHAAAQSIGGAPQGPLSGYPVIVFRSTMPPGTVRDRLIPQIETMAGKTAGLEFGVCYSPEYLRADTAYEDFLAPRLVLFASTDPHAAAVVKSIFEPLHAAIVEGSFAEAEFQKYVHNLFNATKISYFNEMRRAASRLGIDPTLSFEVTAITTEASWNPSYGIANKGPYGGACLPKDTVAWLRFAAELGIETPLISAVDQVNNLVGNQILDLPAAELGDEVLAGSLGHADLDRVK